MLINETFRPYYVRPYGKVLPERAKTAGRSVELPGSRRVNYDAQESRAFA
jgi:hypothetical protein